MGVLSKYVFIRTLIFLNFILMGAVRTFLFGRTVLDTTVVPVLLLSCSSVSVVSSSSSDWLPAANTWLRVGKMTVTALVVMSSENNSPGKEIDAFMNWKWIPSSLSCRYNAKWWQNIRKQLRILCALMIHCDCRDITQTLIKHSGVLVNDSQASACLEWLPLSMNSVHRFSWRCSVMGWWLFYGSCFSPIHLPVWNQHLPRDSPLPVPDLCFLSENKRFEWIGYLQNENRTNHYTQLLLS